MLFFIFLNNLVKDSILYEIVTQVCVDYLSYVIGFYALF